MLNNMYNSTIFYLNITAQKDLLKITYIKEKRKQVEEHRAPE